jgi:retron-type reverse transcriptase
VSWTKWGRLASELRARHGYRHRGHALCRHGCDTSIHQAVLQVLQRLWDATLSASANGFRPGRSAQQAAAQAQKYIVEAYCWFVDFDLEKLFDRVNHDKLMGQIASMSIERVMCG